MTRILLADDHAILRSGLIQILAEEFPEAEFGEAGSVRETLALLQGSHWSVLVLDIFMPDGSGLEVLRHPAVTQGRIPVLVLSSAPEKQLAKRMLQCGAAGYLNKQAAPEELVLALQRILAGGKYVGSRLAEMLVSELAGPVRAPVPHEQLSDREFQVMQRLLAGKSVKEIAGELGLSSKTISTFHARLLEKLRLRNDVELVHYAIGNGLLERNAPVPAAQPPANP